MNLTSTEIARQIGIPDLPESGRYNGAEVQVIKRQILNFFRASTGLTDVKLYPSSEDWAYGFSPQDEEYLNSLMDRGGGKRLVEALRKVRPQALYYHVEEICTRPPIQLVGLMEHEIAHARHSDFAELVLGVMRAEKEGFLNTTFVALQQGAEDARVNRIASGSSRTARESIAELDAEWLQNIPQRAASQSLVMQYALSCYYYSLRGEFMPQVLDDRVQDACSRTESALRRYMASDDAQLAAGIMSRDIWPIARELEKQDVNDRACHLMREDRFWERLKRRLKRTLPCPFKRLSQSDRRRLLESFDKLPEEKQKVWRLQARCELDAEQAGQCNTQGPKGLVFAPDPLSGEHTLGFRLAPNLKQTEEIRAWLYGLAMEMDGADAAEAVIVAAETENELKRKKAGFTQGEYAAYTKYEKAWAEVCPRVNRLVQDLKRILPPSAQELMDGEYYSGPQLDLDLVRQKVPIGDFQVYRRREIQTLPEPQVEWYLVLDNSPSMRKRQKLQEARKAALLFMATFDALSLPCAVLTFGHKTTWIKQIAESYSSASDRVRPKLMSVFHANEDGTNIGKPVTELRSLIMDRRRRSPETTFVVTIISDGSATLGLKGSRLKAAVDQLSQVAVVSNVSLGCKPKEIEEARGIFGPERVVVVDDVESLSGEFTRKVKFMFQQLSRIRS